MRRRIGLVEEFRGQVFEGFEMEDGFSLYLDSEGFMKMMKFTFNAWELFVKIRLKAEMGEEDGAFFEEKIGRLDNMEEDLDMAGILSGITEEENRLLIII